MFTYSNEIRSETSIILPWFFILSCSKGHIGCLLDIFIEWPCIKVLTQGLQTCFCQQDVEPTIQRCSCNNTFGQ